MISFGSLRATRLYLGIGALALAMAAAPAPALQKTRTIQVVDSARALHFKWSAHVSERGGHFLLGQGNLAAGEERIEVDAIEGTSAYEAKWNRPAAAGFFRIVYRTVDGRDLLLASVLVIPAALDPVEAPGRSPERQVAASTRWLLRSADLPRDIAVLALPGTIDPPPIAPIPPPPRA